MNDLLTQNIDLPMKKIETFCQKWQIVEFALFGSVLREDFGPNSDIDVLILPSTDARWTLLDHVDMQFELKEIFDRPVDLLTRRSVERDHNDIRRKHILEKVEVIYERVPQA